ncbi:MAG: GNAT family N-acetyltransferase [Oscillospiraceae bacterium]|nr:GNAT family N-acetyltransferase [Oscillospiraceae bacterium]
MITIRRAEVRDAAAIQLLNRECLGYDYPLKKTREKLAAAIEDPGQCVLVAELDPDVIAGYIHLEDYDTLYFDPMKNILGIAVFMEFRRRGIATRLLTEAEEWAAETGASGIRLVSGYDREDAHAFYERMGYINRKLQKNYIKKI